MTAVTGVLITAVPTTLKPGDTASVFAWVDGLGVGERDVTWKLVQGEGQLTQKNGRSALFEANAAFTGTVVLEAIPEADPSRSATVTLTVAPPKTSLISMEIREPGCWTLINYQSWTCPMAPAGDSGTVSAFITSTYEFNAVARVPGTGLEAPLMPRSDAPLFQGSLDLRTLRRGQHLLELSVTDSRGNALDIPGTFVVDRAPTLEVAEPATWQVATPSTLRVRASCRDDAGACALEARLDSLRATGNGTLDTTWELATLAGRTVELVLSAEDSLGQITSRSFRVAVVGPSLEPVARVPGQLLQADASRLLYTTGGGRNVAPTGLGILQRASGQVSPVLTPPGSSVSQAQLTSSGVVFFTQPVSGNPLDRALYEARPDSLVDLDPGRTPAWIRARGDYVLWTTYPEADLMLRRLSTGTTVRVAAAGNSNHDVTEQGFVAFGDKEYDILTYQDGVTQRLTNDPDTVAWNVDPVTDGALVAYSKRVTQTQTAIALHTGGQELLLTQPRPWDTVMPGSDYAVNAGWVAYTEPGSGGQMQVLLRSPAGETRKVTDLGTSSTIGALGPEGQVAARNLMNGREHVHVSSGPGDLRDLGVVEGKVVWLDEAWHVLWADTLFRVR